MKNVLIKILSVILLVSLILYGRLVLNLSFYDSRIIWGQEDLEERKLLVMSKKDELAYLHLTNHYNEEHNFQNLLPYSLKMSSSMDIANNYFFETYKCIRITKNYKMEDFVKLDKPECDFYCTCSKMVIKPGLV